jgi:hypothetical protein
MSRRTGTALLVLATCLGVQGAVAQVKAGQSRTSFGIVGGLNLAKFTGTDATGLDTRSAFFAGAAVRVPLGTSLFFEPQALYSMQGAKMSVSGATATFALDYVQVPLLLGARIPMQGSGIRPYFMAGPYLGFKMGCKIKVSGAGASGNTNCDDPAIALEMKGFDYGLSLGAGVDVPVGAGSLSLGARFSMGLTDVEKNSKLKNSVFSFGLGYFFGR